MRKTIIDSPTSPSCAFESCATPARDNGWCATHGYAAQLLRLALHYGCPEYVGETLHISARLSAWEAYCERVTEEHAREIEQALRAQYGKGKVA